MSDETKFKAVHKMNLNNFLQQGEGQFIEFKEKFGFISLPRNKLLADVISKTIFMEKVGTGIKRIKDYCYNNNNNGIKFEVEDYFFTIINSNKSGTNPAQIRHRWILKYLKTHKEIRNSIVAKEFLINRDTARNDLNKLIEQGKIVKKGAGNNVWYELK